MCVIISQHFCQGGHLFPFCPPTTTPVVSAYLFSVNRCLSLSSISICDALWKKPYLRFLTAVLQRSHHDILQSCFFPPFQHRITTVHFVGMDWACTHLPWSSTNETKLLPLYLLVCHHKVFHLLHMITVFCFTVSLFLLLHVCTCGRMKSNTMILLPAQHDQHFLFLKMASKFVVVLPLPFPAWILVPVFSYLASCIV